jgi:hypothetical protein
MKRANRHSQGLGNKPIAAALIRRVHIAILGGPSTPAIDNTIIH